VPIDSTNHAPSTSPSPETLAVAEALRDSAQNQSTRSWRHRLLSHIPPGQFARYLCVGVFNTLFGYTTFAIINFLLHRRHVPASYLFAYALSNFINITVAYLGYKLFVFRTQGNYLREWLKAMAVYWSGFVPGLILLPILVRACNLILPAQLSGFHHTVGRAEAAPYIANAFLLCFGVFYSFIGHKKITFRQPDA
jgi:putative flippase GtrA